MPEYRTINVDPETYDRIASLAEESGRTIGGQIAYMAKLVTNELVRMQVVKVSPTPSIESETETNHE